MKKFLCRRITFRIPVLLLIILGIAILLASLWFWTDLPENTFFAILQPEWVTSGTVTFYNGQQRDMTRDEVGEVVAILRGFRIEDKVPRAVSPTCLSDAEFSLRLQWGTVLYIHCGTKWTYAINHDRYQYSPALHELYLLFREKYLPEQKGAGTQ